MEKEMLAIGKFKDGEGNLEKFMKFFQSDEGMEMRKSVAYVEKTIAGILPDKSGIIFKVHVHNEQGMKDLKSALKAGLISVNEYSTLVYQLHQKNK